MAFQVDKKTALVTGGGSGIGLEFTKLLLQNGCNVVIADLGLRPEAEEVVHGKQKGTAIFQKTDVTDWAQLKAAFDIALKEFGSLDIVCPGAGVYEPAWSNFWKFTDSLDTVDTSSYKTLDINVNHPIRATQLAIDSFKRQKLGHGSIVLISSMAAQLANFSAPMYTASKAAISAFTRALGPLENTVNIRCTAVAPGVVRTPLLDYGSLKDGIDEKVDTLILPEKVAEVMLALIQDPAYVGGTVLEVGAEDVRKVERLNDPGPQGKKGCTASKVINLFNNTNELIESEFGR